jgi:2-polyprenyl-6-methoxyphenol hydroxylase-like FAD-dependent oxidoreductase
MAAMSRQHVAIVGAGPAGLLLAISLLEPHFSERFRVVVYEGRGRGDVHTPERGWAMPLGVRGRAAIQSVDGGQLWAAVAPVRIDATLDSAPRR